MRSNLSVTDKKLDSCIKNVFEKTLEKYRVPFIKLDDFFDDAAYSNTTSTLKKYVVGLVFYRQILFLEFHFHLRDAAHADKFIVSGNMLANNNYKNYKYRNVFVGNITEDSDSSEVYFKQLSSLLSYYTARAAALSKLNKKSRPIKMISLSPQEGYARPYNKRMTILTNGNEKIQLKLENSGYATLQELTTQIFNNREREFDESINKKVQAYLNTFGEFNGYRN